MMYLHACTNKHGSESSTSLGVEKEEWEALSVEEQNDLIRESLGDIVDSWVEEKD